MAIKKDPASLGDEDDLGDLCPGGDQHPGAANYYFGSHPGSQTASRQRSGNVSTNSGFKGPFIPTGPDDPRYPVQMRSGFCPPNEGDSYAPSMQEQHTHMLNQTMLAQANQLPGSVLQLLQS